MPNYNKRAIGSKRLNKVLASYPNVYFSLHEGLAGSDPGNIPDQNGSDLVLYPATATATQWTDKPGYWSCSAANAADYLQCNRQDDLATYDSLFSFGSNVIVIMMYVFADTDPTNSGRTFVMGNQDPDFIKIFEGKYLNTGILQMVTDFGTLEAATSLDLPAEAAPNESVMIIKLDCAQDTISLFNYAPATKTLQDSATTPLTTPSYPASNPTNSRFYLGVSPTAGGHTSYGQSISYRDLRIINFGATPPSDLSEILEELAINSCLGTRR